MNVFIHTILGARRLKVLTPISLQLNIIRNSAPLSTKARPVKRSKPTAQGNQEQHFIDFKRLRVQAGNGGNGCLSFLRLPFKEWAGPDGGDGGNGGHVIFEATTNEKSLAHLKAHYHGYKGVSGRNRERHGRNAKHLYIKVPVGTLFKDEDNNQLADLAKPGDYFVAAHGGRGGKGNNYFLSNEVRAPMTYEVGGEGENKLLFTELRVMAHAGLVGFPNAGKSSLLRAVSRARPKVASYPFTTLNPHVGMVLYDDHEQVAVADIPGIIKGSHQDEGLGLSFLRHIERCVCLLYVLDLSVNTPWTQLDDLKFELEQYQEGLSSRPHMIVGNKMDLPVARDNFSELSTRTDLPIIGVSAKTGNNTHELLLHLRKMYNQYVQTFQPKPS